MQSPNSLDLGETGANALLERADEYARNEPTTAVAGAFGAGLLLTLLPLGAMTGSLVRISLSFTRPVLLGLGLMKALELIRSRSHNPTQPK